MRFVQSSAHSGMLGALPTKQKRNWSRAALMLRCQHRCTVGLAKQLNRLRLAVDHDCTAVGERLPAHLQGPFDIRK